MELQNYYKNLDEYQTNVKETTITGTGFKYVNILEMPICRQAHNFTCGVACVQSALRFAGYDFDTREDSLLKALGATPENELGERWHDSDGETTLNYYGFVLNYVILPDSEQNTFYKLG